MATGFRKILEGLRLIPKAASTASEKGDLDVVTSSGKLNYHDGTTASPIVTEDHSATLSNKTLDAAVVDNDLDLNNFALLNTGSIESSQQINIVIPNTYPSGLLITDDPTYTTATYALHISGSPSGVIDIYSGYNSIDFHNNTTKFWDDGDGVSKVEIGSPEGAIYLSKVFPITPTTLLTISSPEQTISGDDTGPLLIATGNGAIDANSGIIEIQTGNAESSSGFVSIQTGGANINSGAITLQTGGSANGSTGNINITTGYSGLGPSSRGDINLDCKQFTISGQQETAILTDVYIFGQNNSITLGEVTNPQVRIKWDDVSTPNQLVIDDNGSTLVPVKLANPVINEHAATKQYVDAVNYIQATTSVGLAVGNLVYVDNTGVARKLDAADDTKVEFVGVVSSISGGNAIVQISGPITITAASFTVGKPVYANPATPGALTSTVPSNAGQWIIPVGIAISATKIVINAAGSATAVKITSEVDPYVYATVTSISSNTTLTNGNSIVLATGGAGGITVTLPAPTSGKIFNIKKVDSAPGVITISPSSGTIDGAANKTISSQFDSITITSDGTNYFLI